MTGEACRSVVAGIDGSAGGLAAAEWAAGEAARQHAPLRLVHCDVPPFRFTTAGLPRRKAEAQVRMRHAEQILAQASEWVRARHPAIEVTTAMIEGSPAGVLVNESRAAGLVVVGADGAGGVVVGADGAGGVCGLLTGPVGRQVAMHAYGPVILVREPTGEAAAGLPVVVGVDGSGTASTALGYAFDVAAARAVPLIAIHVQQDLPPADHVPGERWRYRQVEVDSAAHRRYAEQLASWQEKFPEVAVDSRVGPLLAPGLSVRIGL